MRIRLPNYDMDARKASPKSAKSHDFVVDLYKYVEALLFIFTLPKDIKLFPSCTILAFNNNKVRACGKRRDIQK